MKFEISDNEIAVFKKWKENHNKVCKFYDDDPRTLPKTGAIGGRFTFMFTPTSIGGFIKVRCACGEEIDITDYSWF